MPAAPKLEGDALAAQLTPLVMPATELRRAGIVVCSQARDTADAIELLDMLGLRTPPAPATAPPPPTRRRRKPASAPVVAEAAAAQIGDVAEVSAEVLVELPATLAVAVEAAAPENPAAHAETDDTSSSSSVPSTTNSTAQPELAASADEASASTQRAPATDKPTRPAQHRPRAAATRRARAVSAQWTDVTVAAAHGVVIDCSASGVPAVGTCQGADCGRPMVSVRAYRKDDCWRRNGFVYHDAHGLCHRCYMAWYYRHNQPAPAATTQDTPANDVASNSSASHESPVDASPMDEADQALPDLVEPTFPAAAVVVAELYPVLCTECGVVGATTPSTLTAAEQLREQHLSLHRVRVAQPDVAQPDVPQPRPAHRSESPLLAGLGGAR